MFIVLICCLTQCWSSLSVRVDTTCRQNFSYRQGLQGTFKSPGFPDKYPLKLKCFYMFDAVNNGGVQIKFEIFDLEEKADNENA